MLKKIFVLLAFASILFVACNNGNSNGNSDEGDTNVVETDDITQISVADFDAEAVNYVDKTIKIEGTVSHICKHGGKKMFIFAAPVDSITVKITSNEAFNADLEGSDVVVTAIVKEERITKDDIVNMIEELANCDTEGAELHEDDHHDEHVSQETIDYYNGLIEESGKDYIAFYTLECVEYEEKK